MTVIGEGLAAALTGTARPRRQSPQPPARMAHALNQWHPMPVPVGAVPDLFASRVTTGRLRMSNVRTPEATLWLEFDRTNPNTWRSRSESPAQQFTEEAA